MRSQIHMSSDKRQELGKSGENLACAELERRGYAILERRYRTRFGEIDIIASDHGTIVFVEVKARMGGDVLMMRSARPEALQRHILEGFGLTASVVENEVRLRHADAQELIVPLITRFKDEVESVTLSKPTLEDLFIQETGRKLKRTEQVPA